MSGSPLAQPIQGGVSSDGRLVFADDTLWRLHHRAGGLEGGALAIPGLAALASLSHKLKMRLSRAVKVADANEDLELWVEAIPDGNLAKLSILSWRTLTTFDRLYMNLLRLCFLKPIFADSILMLSKPILH